MNGSHEDGDARRICRVRDGPYIIVAPLRGSGFRPGPGHSNWLCGEDPARFRMQKRCAQIDTDFGGAARMQQVLLL